MTLCLAQPTAQNFTTFLYSAGAWVQREGDTKRAVQCLCASVLQRSLLHRSHQDAVSQLVGKGYKKFCTDLVQFDGVLQRLNAVWNLLISVVIQGEVQLVKLNSSAPMQGYAPSAACFCCCVKQW